MNKAVPENQIKDIQKQNKIDELESLECVKCYDKTSESLVLKEGLNLFPRELLPFCKIVKILHIPKFNGTFLPNAFSKFVNLEELYMNGSRLLTFPFVFRKMRLKVLSVTDGILDHFFIDNVPLPIEELIVDNNNLSSIPDGFNNREFLKRISILGNPLSIDEVRDKVKKSVEVNLK